MNECVIINSGIVSKQTTQQSINQNENEKENEKENTPQIYDGNEDRTFSLQKEDAK